MEIKSIFGLICYAIGFICVLSMVTDKGITGVTIRLLLVSVMLCFAGLVILVGK